MTSNGSDDEPSGSLLRLARSEAATVVQQSWRRYYAKCELQRRRNDASRAAMDRSAGALICSRDATATANEGAALISCSVSELADNISDITLSFGRLPFVHPTSDKADKQARDAIQTASGCWLNRWVENDMARATIQKALSTAVRCGSPLVIDLDRPTRLPTPSATILCHDQVYEHKKVQQQKDSQTEVAPPVLSICGDQYLPEFLFKSPRTIYEHQQQNCNLFWLHSPDIIEHASQLGVAIDASASQVNARYHLLARELHPDRGGTNEGFSRLNAAYKAMKDHIRVTANMTCDGTAATAATSADTSSFDPETFSNFDIGSAADASAESTSSSGSHVEPGFTIMVYSRNFASPPADIAVVTTPVWVHPCRDVRSRMQSDPLGLRGTELGSNSEKKAAQGHAITIQMALKTPAWDAPGALGAMAAAADMRHYLDVMCDPDDKRTYYDDAMETAHREKEHLDLLQRERLRLRGLLFTTAIKASLRSGGGDGSAVLNSSSDKTLAQELAEHAKLVSAGNQAMSDARRASFARRQEAKLAKSKGHALRAALSAAEKNVITAQTASRAPAEKSGKVDNMTAGGANSSSSSSEYLQKLRRREYAHRQRTSELVNVHVRAALADQAKVRQVLAPLKALHDAANAVATAQQQQCKEVEHQQALECAAQADFADIHCQVFSRGPEIGVPASARAEAFCDDAFDDNIGAVVLALQEGLACVESCETHGYTALSEACCGGATRVAKLLLALGADPNTYGCAGGQRRTPLIRAAFNGHNDIVEMLLTAGADPRPLRNASVVAPTKAQSKLLETWTPEKTAEAAEKRKVHLVDEFARLSRQWPAEILRRRELALMKSRWH